MMGYKDNEEGTRRVVDYRGYFNSADLGLIDEDNGFLSVVGQIEELIVMQSGKKVSPYQIEELFKTLCPVCSNIIVVGEGRPFISALITLKVKMNV